MFGSGRKRGSERFWPETRDGTFLLNVHLAYWQKYQDLIAGPSDSAITINMTNDLDLKLV